MSTRERSSPPEALEAERRQLTVMFADLTSSTALSTRLEPEDFRDLMHAWRNCVTGLVVRYGGRVTTHMGDGILAFFGYPHANEVDAERAVRCSLAVIEAVRRLPTEAGPSGTLSARIGLATGPVIVGDLIGAGSSLEWSVVSETTNLAARLQTQAQPHMVAIDDLTRHLSGGMFDYAAMGPVQLKGITAPVPVWTVLRESGVDSRFDALRTRQLPLVGREDEASLLQRRWAKAMAGIGHAVVLVGEAGLGKSRLIAAFEEQLGGAPRSVLRFSCSPHYQDTPLYPLIRYFEAAVGFRQTDTPAQKFDRLRQCLARTSCVGGPETAVLADLLSIPASAERPAQQISERTNQSTFTAILRYVEALASKGPLLLIVEDFHWADPSTVALLDILIDEVEHIPALFVISTRPERRLLWSLYPQVTTQLLNGLDRRQAALVIRQIAAERAIADDVLVRIVERAQGVPLFLEELTRSILTNSLPGNDNDRRGRDLPVSGDAVPTSLNALLMARLDQLDAGKDVAQASSVIGREFSFEMLQRVSGLPTKRLEDALNELAQAGLIVAKGPPASVTHVFYHALIQEVAYGSMLRDRRRAFHSRYAQALEKDPAGPAATAPELLAAHFAEAGEAEKSIDYYLRAAARATGRFDSCEPEALSACFVETDAAEKAVDLYLKAAHTPGRFALTEIIGYLRKALRQLGDLPVTAALQHRELALQVALGRALMEHRGIGDQEVRATFERAHGLCLILGGTEHLLRVHDGLSNYHLVHSELHKVVEYSKLTLDLGLRTANQHAVVLAYRSSGHAKMLLGDLHGGRDDLQQVIARYNGPIAVRRDPKVSACAGLGICLTALGLPDAGRAKSLEAVRHAENMSDPISLNFALRRACVQAMMRRDARQVLDLYSRLPDHQIGNSSHLADYFLTWAHLQSGCDQALRERICATLDQLESGQNLNLLSFYLLAAAELMLSQGDPGRADALVQRAAALVETTSERWCEAEILRLRARLSSDFANAVALLETSLSVSREQGALLWEVRAATDLAVLWRDQGNDRVARAALAPVLARVCEGVATSDFGAATDLFRSLS